MAQVLKEEVKQAIFESAKREFMINGYNNSSMRKIAKGAGVTVGNLYRYYENKESIYRDLAETVINEIDSILIESSDGLLSFIRGIDSSLKMVASRGNGHLAERIIMNISAFISTLVDEKRAEALILLKTGNQMELHNGFNLVRWLAEIFKAAFGLEHAAYHVAYGFVKSLESIVEMDLSPEETRLRATECIEFITRLDR